MTLLLGANATLMFTLGISYAGQHWPVVLAALAGGVLADALLALLKPSVDRMRALRVFSFATPFSFFLLYFAALILSSGVWWRIHMWLGAPSWLVLSVWRSAVSSRRRTARSQST